MILYGYGKTFFPDSFKKKKGAVQMDKKQILLKRGFGAHDIATGFAEYKGNWNISTITKKQLMTASDAKQLNRLFDMDSVDNNNWCCTYYGYSFDFFAKDISPFEVAPSELDPYIARLCKAVNSIGVKTCMSCDGWHKDDSFNVRLMKLYMTDRYSVIWFWLITEYIFGEYWQHSQPLRYGWYNVWEPNDREYGARRDMMSCLYSINEAEQLFNKQDCYACFIETHRNEFLDLRKALITSLYDKMKNNVINNIDSVNFMKARQYMYNIFLPLSEQLKNSFINEYRNIFNTNIAMKEDV